MTEPPPLLRVVRGRPNSEESAALAVVIGAKLATRPEQAREERAAVRGWADRARALRTPLSPGPGAWRSSARPG